MCRDLGVRLAAQWNAAPAATATCSFFPPLVTFKLLSELLEPVLLVLDNVSRAVVAVCSLDLRPDSQFFFAQAGRVDARAAPGRGHDDLAADLLVT